MLTQEILKIFIKYDPLTGYFYKIPSGLQVGSANSKGYVYINLGTKKYLAHRLAWLYMTGEWPDFEVDHEDTNKSNNIWKNLREATRGQNLQNRKKAQTNNKSTNTLGVYLCGKRFMTRLQTDYGVRYLGTYDTIAEAKEVYIEAKRKYHPFGTL